MTLGGWGEQCASDYLQRQGFRILAQNFRCRFGEIDLIAEDSEYLVFVEVKTRRSTRFGTPAQAVTPAKQRKLTLTAQSWLQEHPTQRQPRFDVVEIYARGADRPPTIVVLPNAFEAIE